MIISILFSEMTSASEDIVSIETISGYDAIIEHTEEKKNKSKKTTTTVTSKKTIKLNHEETAKIRRKSAQETKQRKNPFEQLFAENKHRFDMSCDKCSYIFESYHVARSHYATAHNNKMGYIKCCNRKLIYPYQIENHLRFHHLGPDKFQYVLNLNWF